MEEIALKNDEFLRGNNAIGQMTLRHKMLLVAGAALGLACGFGPVFIGAWVVFLKPMALSLDWSRADVALLPTFGSVGIVIGAPCIGYIADRIGWNKVIAFSVVLFPLSLLAISVAPPSYSYIVGIGLLSGIAGAATTAAGYIAVISRVFDRRLGLALGFSTIGIGVGVMVVPVAATKLLEFMDWRQAYVCIAGSALLLGAVAHQIIFRVMGVDGFAADSDRSRTGSVSKDMADPGQGFSFRQAIGDYRFWLLGIVAAIVLCATGGASQHIAAYVTDRGISPMMAAQAVGLGGLGTMVARLGIGLILDRVFAPFVALCAFLFGAIGLYLLTTDFLQATLALPLAAILIGVVGGAEGDLLPFLVRKYFGIRAFGSIYGSLFGLLVAGSALGSYTYGLSFDILKSYVPILEVSAILCCTCGLAILTLGRYRFVTGKVESV
jgi:predicted MFS family arabinose efflux permease